LVKKVVIKLYSGDTDR